jgi:hypothetical protein
VRRAARRGGAGSREMWAAFLLVGALAVATHGNLPKLHLPAKGAAAAPVSPAANVGPGETGFWTAVLLNLGDRPTTADLASLSAWYHHEEPSWPPPYRNNPLNTKRAEPGSWTSSGNGVQNYPTRAWGVAATVAALTNGLYPHIVAGLRGGAGLCGGGLAADFETWSGPGGYSAIC